MKAGVLTYLQTLKFASSKIYVRTRSCTQKSRDFNSGSSLSLPSTQLFRPRSTIPPSINHSTLDQPFHPRSIIPPSINHSTLDQPFHPRSIIPPSFNHSTLDQLFHPRSTIPPSINHSTLDQPFHPRSTIPPSFIEGGMVDRGWND